jgi:RNA polymerase sigma factor (sigma-70 family)
VIYRVPAKGPDGDERVLTTVHGEVRKKRRLRNYSPVVEALEALRLLSGSSAVALPGLAVERDLLGGPLSPDTPSMATETWDSALVQTRLTELLATPDSAADAQAAESGFRQLERYLSRAWYRAGVPVQQHDDCSQAVYVSLLQGWGTDRFDRMITDIGHGGVREVLSRDTADGPDFFRAVDTVKKRAQRERNFQPLDDKAELVAAPRDDSQAARWRGALQEAIDQSLTPREAALIYATLKGETPLEIASQWGLAPKTVSNEKTRVIQKLRDFLVTDLPD